MKFAFLGFDFFSTTVPRLISAGWEPCKIFSFPVDGKYNRNEQVAAIAKAHNIELQVTRVSLADITELRQMGCEFLISAAYPYKIPIDDNDGLRGINIHPTLLPEGRGPWPLPHIILRGLEKSGVTIHKLTSEFDAGDILFQKEFFVSENENLESLSCKMQIHACQAIDEFIINWERAWQHAVRQTEGSYWAKPCEFERTLNWNQSVAQIERVVRAFGKFESWANFDNTDWLIRDATVWREAHEYEPGVVIHRTSGEVVISALDGFVCLREFSAE